MAVTAVTFPQFQQKAGTKLVNVSTDSLKVMLLSAYTFANTHATMADVVAAGTEISGTGYTAGGQALTSVSFSTTGTVTKLTCANPAWTTATLTNVNYAVFFDAAGGTNATNYPICYWNLGGAQSVTGGTFTLTINASGLYTVTSS